MQSLTAVRDLLLPGVKAMENCSNIVCDLQVDFVNDNLVCLSKDKRIVIVSRKEIKDGSYKETFAPRLRNFLGLKEEN